MSSGFSATALIWFGKGGLKKYINQFLTTGAIPKGSWDAATNTPRLINGTGTVGWYYDVVEAGSQFGYNFLVGDRVLYADNKWQRVPTGVESDNPIVVAYVDENTVAFPTARPSGMPLKIGDWVEVKSTAVLDPPIVIEGITIDSYSDKVEWNGTTWQLKDYASAKSNEVALNKPLKESISGSAEFQSESNIEFVEAFKKIITFRGYIKTTEPTGEIVIDSFWYQGTMPVSYPIQVKTYDGVEWSATTETYTPSLFDYVSDLNTNKDYYWFNGKWNLLNNDIDYKVVSTFYEVEGNTHTLYILTENVTVGADKYVKGVYEWDSTNGFVLKYAFREYLEVETFVGVEGNEYTLYILTEDVTISGRKYPRGFYTWDSVNGFVARSSVVEVDNETIDKDENGKLEIKLEGIETKHIKPSALAKSTDNVRNYQNSADTKVATEKFLQKTLLNIETPENNKDAANKKYVDDEIKKVVERTFTFKGFVSTTAPADNIKTGSYWYESATLPTTFPINVKTYDGTNWSSTTSEYNPSQFDYWINDNDNRNYFWNGNNWRIFDSEVLVDNTTIERNNEGKLEVKDEGISKDKLNSNVADNDTLEKDDTDGLRLKDEAITFAKLNPELTKQSLANDYYFKFSDGTNTYYTKTIVDGENIDVYVITISNNKITAITLQETKGTLANGVLTFSSVEYTHDIFGDGFYVVGDDEILITISALQDILDKAGKVNDIKVAGISQVKNKEANIQTIDNIEDNFYYAFKNGSTYYYTKSKATGSTAYYQFTYTDNVLTKIENKGNATIELNANRVPQITISSVVYTLDETKNDYYIINPKQKLPSVENETRDLTDEELNRIFEDFYLTPPNPSWKYVGILPASNGSTLKVEDDWTELLLVMRVMEDSKYYYNLTNVIPKYGFTQGSPTNNLTFAGFYWNDTYNVKIRVGLTGTGANRVIRQDYSQVFGWVLNGTYIFKR